MTFGPLLLFFGEAISTYLRLHALHICNLQLLLVGVGDMEQELLDIEYANDTPLYTAFSLGNMDW